MLEPICSRSINWLLWHCYCKALGRKIAISSTNVSLKGNLRIIVEAFLVQSPYPSWVVMLWDKVCIKGWPLLNSPVHSYFKTKATCFAVLKIILIALCQWSVEIHANLPTLLKIILEIYTKNHPHLQVVPVLLPTEPDWQGDIHNLGWWGCFSLTRERTELCLPIITLVVSDSNATIFAQGIDLSQYIQKA